ncbi:site-specific integrase [Pseudomonas fluorescens]|uniref:site-specific integrase n=1 Tax=Pseudomonas fluorescens TaxID=294 RepID=UPI003749F570
MNRILPELSAGVLESFTSFDGYHCSLVDEYWILNRNVTLNIKAVRGLLPAESEQGLIQTLKVFATNSSAHHVQNIYTRYCALLRFASGEPVSPNLIARYRQTLSADNEWYLGAIRVLIKQWHRLGYPGLHPELNGFLTALVLRANRKGEAVKQLDPERGPLSDIELLGFNDDVVQAYEVGSISITELALSLLASHTGSRPIQLTNTRLVDLSDDSNDQGGQFFFIAIPRAKQPGHAFRVLFRKRAITEELFTILSAQATYVRSTAAAIWSFTLSESMANQLPLFPNWKALKAIRSQAEFAAMMVTDRLHLGSRRVSVILQRITEQIGFISERTDRTLNLSARRFRYTVGTRAAREGYGPLVIAELLDHSNTQYVGVYTQNVPEHAARIDQAVASQLAPFAQAFAGVIVSSRAAATRGDDPASDVRSTSGRGAGTCGSFGFCAANVPIPCYTCIHFQPWLDGPHQEVLSELLEERERVVGATHDLTIASVLDRSILAVTQVVEACNAQRSEATSKNDSVGT